MVDCCGLIKLVAGSQPRIYSEELEGTGLNVQDGTWTDSGVRTSRVREAKVRCGVNTTCVFVWDQFECLYPVPPQSPYAE